ncbi:MAG TPA: hypothetical protein VIL92_06315 [Gaiellaceae bacterium]
MGDPTDHFERGKREGRVDATLEAHGRHLTRINGNIERFATAIETLTTTMLARFDKSDHEILTLQEDGRSAALAVTVAAETLETDAERRRGELAETAAGLAVTAKALETSETKDDRAFSKRERLAALAVSIVGAAVYIYVQTH